jgi:hypothetical protein
MFIINWIKNNKLSSLLLLIVLYFLLKNTFSFFGFKKTPLLQRADYGYSSKSMLPVGVGGGGEVTSDIIPPSQEAPPTTDVKNRLVIKESYLSLLVNNVVNVQKQIIKKAESLAGYMVNSNLDNPQEAATATVIVRVPSEKLDEALDYFRGLSVKVISENLQGQDVTDQYVDIESRLSTLLKTKAKFEEIMEKATEIQDILNVQREIVNLQSEIDGLKGQKQYLEQSAKLAKLTLYLSTDELALPYAPSEAWRPQVIFKQAVRSLVGSLRKIGTVIIWLTVYSVVWIPVGIILFIFYRKKRG